MKKDRFLKEFQRIDFDEITVYIKNLGKGKIKYSLIFTFGDDIRKVSKISSKEFLKEFMDNICYKLKDEKIILTKNSIIEDRLYYYDVKTENDNIILLMSEIGLDNEFFKETIEYTSNKKSEYILDKFTKSIEKDEIKTLSLKESKEDGYSAEEDGIFQYIVSTRDVKRRREIENICNILASFVNRYRGELSDVKRQYMSDTKECFRVEITLGKSILNFDEYNSKVGNKEDIRKIIITGKELINVLEPKLEEIESVINKNKKLVMESE